MSVASEYMQVEKMSLEEVIRDHAYLVSTVAHQLRVRLPSSVDLDDLKQAGTIGLIEAARSFSASAGCAFTTWARYRIRGAMIDELRHLDWTPRSVARKVREMGEVVRQVENENGGAADDAEVMRRLGMNADEYYRVIADAVTVKLVNYSRPGDQEGTEAFAVISEDERNPEETVEKEDLVNHLAEAIGSLPEREQLVLSLHYEQELNLREIGEVLQVTESRVCQIHGQSLVRLRARLAGLREGTTTGSSPSKKARTR